jgi:hypothetical protein
LTDANIDACCSVINEKADWLDDYILLGHYYDMMNEVGKPIDINEWIRKISTLLRNPRMLGLSTSREEKKNEEAAPTFN